MDGACGSLINETNFTPIPIPSGDELIHATDSDRTALFIWRARWFNEDKNEPQLDQRHVNIARTDLDQDSNARVLCISVGAIDNPIWVTSIVNTMGFKLSNANFGMTRANQVPVDHWQFLTDAAAKRMAAIKQGEDAQDPQAPKQSSN